MHAAIKIAAEIALNLQPSYPTDTQTSDIHQDEFQT
jgi:hypothetical protein